MLQKAVIKLKFGNRRLGIETPQGIHSFLSQSAKEIAWQMTQLLLMVNAPLFLAEVQNMEMY